MHDPTNTIPSQERSLKSVAAIIPAWEPDPGLISIVRSLIEYGFQLVVVVDDGSSAPTQHVFDRLRELPSVHVIRQEQNRGKGSALKVAFRYVLKQHAHLAGVVTADADGQHTPEDIAKVGLTLLAHPEKAVLGSRQFGPGVPARSRIGNIFTRSVFRFLIGSRLSDTQTGLRGLPLSLLQDLLRLPGDRYQFETTMLAHLCRSKRCPREVPISTVYIDSNRSSHFHPLWDSLSIYGVLLRFYARSLMLRFRAGRQLP